MKTAADLMNFIRIQLLDLQKETFPVLFYGCKDYQWEKHNWWKQQRKLNKGFYPAVA